MFDLLAPNDPPLNVTVYILNETSIKVNWTILSSPVDGYVIEYNDSTGSGNVLDVITDEVVIDNLSLSLYTISVYSYKDVISLNTTQATFI